MAGIGFNLRKILESDTYFSGFRAYFYSTVIAAGPWILSILTLFALNYFAPDNISLYEVVYFRSLIIYTFAFSLIGIGILQFPLTRYIADKLYLGEKESIVPVFNTAAVMILVVQAVVGMTYVLGIGRDYRIGFLAVLIYLAINMIWLCMIFLSALRDYRTISVDYLIGTVVAILSAIGFGERWGLEGYLAGYLLGHLIIIALWTARIFSEYPSKLIFDFNFLSFFIRQKMLLLTGFVYALAIWIDKIVFWFSPHGAQVAPGIRMMPMYDFATFMAYLTIIPSLSMFLIQVETDFYRRYKRFYLAILSKASYSRIERVRGQIGRSLRNGASTLIRYQGIVSLAAIVFAPQIAEFFHTPGAQIPLFRVITAGAFLHSLLLITLLIILYFDFRNAAFAVVVVFCVTNALFSWITANVTLPFFGFGYLFSCFVSLIFAFYVLDFNLKRLQFLTFATQPVGIHRENEVT